MVTERREHAQGGDECDHAGATLSEERTDPDDGEWAGATEVGARRSTSDFGDQRRGRQPRPRLHAAHAGFMALLHALDQHMHSESDGAMAWHGAVIGGCGMAMGRGASGVHGAGARCSHQPRELCRACVSRRGRCGDCSHACTYIVAWYTGFIQDRVMDI